MLVAALALGAGFAATVAALAVRRPLVATLGDGYTGRFLAVQGVAINVALFLVVRWAATWSGLSTSGEDAWLPPVYGALFFIYSLSNVDWTARKFHDV